MIIGTPETSDDNLAALSFLIYSCVGITTFPPTCPHFFSEASWSSK